MMGGTLDIQFELFVNLKIARGKGEKNLVGACEEILKTPNETIHST